MGKNFDPSINCFINYMPMKSKELLKVVGMSSSCPSASLNSGTIVVTFRKSFDF